ncbi:MAG: endonuclease, partial [Candidatus Cloacimonetes bacterium]|nr:endonuclease [Candidatus Cloacimonadota bacterium]
SYASGTVNLSGIDWDMTEALIGTLSADWKNGARSCRMRGYGTSAITMLADLSSGAGSISFGYRRYGTDVQVDWKVEYSTNSGFSWIQAGNSFTAPNSDAVQQFNAPLNVNGNIRIRIKRATESGSSNNRLNIDDITLSAYLPTNLPTVSTTPITSITTNSAVSGGNITSQGGSAVIARGVCWSPSPAPTLANSHSSNGSGTGSYISSLSSLASTTTYYVRAYATNSQGTAYGNELSFVTGGSDPFDGYYTFVSGLTGNELKNGLHILLRTTHDNEYGYDDLEDQMKITDEDPSNSNNVIELYTGWSVPKNSYGGGNTDWNKEHTWSKSHGDFGDTAPAGTDLHHLRPCDATVNSFKNNRDFDECYSPYTDNSPPSGYSGATGCYYTTSNDFEPRDADKGDVARMIFYMDARYEGTDTTYDLELVDYVYSDGGINLPYYGKLSTLIAWHSQDPPDAWEALRNNRIQNLQGNRNPFIDHPEYVYSIYGGGLEAPVVFISRSGSTVMLSWTAVSGATSYRVEAANSPYGPFAGVQTTSGLSYSAVTAGFKFFRVIAIN